MTRVVSIDPGMSTGIVVAEYTHDTLPVILGRCQPSGGLQGALFELEETPDDMEMVCEKFSPRPGARSWKLAELEPLRIEGALEALFGSRMVWRKPEQRKLIRSLPQTEAFLKATGYWTEPKSFGTKDADDVNAAMMHLLGYLRDRHHRPTTDLLIDYSERLTEDSE